MLKTQQQKLISTIKSCLKSKKQYKNTLRNQQLAGLRLAYARKLEATKEQLQNKFISER